MKRKLTVFVLCFSLFASCCMMGSSAKYFTDVPSTNAYLDAINYVSDNGYMGGTSSTEFSPTANMTRAMFVTVLYRYAGSPTVTGTEPFTDVATTAWYYDAVRWAYENEYIDGTSSTTFSPNNNITRQDAAVVFYRYAGVSEYSNPSVSLTINDFDNIADYAETAVVWSVDNNVLSLTSRRFRPTSILSRQEMAEAVMQYGVFVEGLNFTRDVYSFTNESENFYSIGASDTRYLEVGTGFYNYLRLKLQDAYGDEVLGVLAEFTDLAGSSWGGSCFGMSSTVALDKMGKIDINGTTSDALSLYSLESPSENELLRNVINYYHVSQVFEHLYPDRQTKLAVGPEIIETMLLGLDSNGLAVCSFYSDWFGHAVLAYEHIVCTDGSHKVYFYDPDYPEDDTYFLISSDLEEMHYYNVDEGLIIECLYFHSITDFDNFDLIDIDGYYNDSLPVYLYTASEVNSVNLSDTMTNGNYPVLVGKAQFILSFDTYAEITNSAGECLIFDHGEISGDMDVWSVRLISGCDSMVSIVVAESDSFNCSLQDDDVYVSLLQGNEYSRVKGTNIESLEFSGESVLVAGDDLTYDTAFFSETDNCIISYYGQTDAIAELFVNGDNQMHS